MTTSKNIPPHAMPLLGALAALAYTMASASTASADASAKLKAYGKHLSSECTTCHRIDGRDNGIPPIIGWPSEAFVAVLVSYRDGERTNQAMVSVAKSLDEQQMEALASYFGSIEPK